MQNKTQGLMARLLHFSHVQRQNYEYEHLRFEAKQKIEKIIKNQLTEIKS